MSGSHGSSGRRCGCGPTGSWSASAGGAEIAELLAAMNTGHDGGAGTVHSTGIAGVGARLEALGALAGLGPDALGRQVRAAVDIVVHLARDGGGRRVERIGRFSGSGLEVVPVG